MYCTGGFLSLNSNTKAITKRWYWHMRKNIWSIIRSDENDQSVELKETTR